jgi:hypothetical protein
VRAQPVDATPSGINLFSKGGIYNAREPGEAFCDAEGRHVEPLEGGAVVASDWARLPEEQGEETYSNLMTIRLEMDFAATAFAAGRPSNRRADGRHTPTRRDNHKLTEMEPDELRPTPLARCFVTENQMDVSPPVFFSEVALSGAVGPVQESP